MTAFDDLRAYQRQTETLKSISGLLSWDMETQMATGSSDKRGEQLAVVSGLVHDRNAAPQLRDLLDAARAEVAQTGDLRHLDLIQIEADAATRIPKDLAMELSRATVKANQAWAEARKTDTPSVFLPHLNTVVRLLRLRAEALRRDDDPVLYDALLRDYEPDAKSAMIDQMFAQLRPRLVDLRAAVMAAPAAPKPRLIWGDPHERASTERCDRFRSRCPARQIP